MKENIFPELSGMELHYSSLNGLAIQNPLNFQSSTSGPTTGGLDNPFVAPRAAESLGASLGNSLTEQMLKQLDDARMKHILYGQSEIKIGIDPAYFDYTGKGNFAEPSEREIALKFLEDIKKMPHCILVDVLIDPDEIYAVDIHEILWVRGDGLTHAQQEFVVEKIKEHCIAKLSVPY